MEKKQYYDQAKQWLETPASVDEVADLRDNLRHHEWRYYVINDPVLTDSEYDQLYHQLIAIETAHPDLITADSPSQRVASDLSESFDSVPHLTPMLSLGNAYSPDDLRKFDEQIKKLTDLDESAVVEYCLEPKFDGGSIALIYENDQYERGATRGNGTMGELITANAKTLPSVPLKANFSNHNIQKAEIRGEAVIRKSNFDSINEQRLREGKSLFANPRNAATGGLRMKDPNETRQRGLEVFAFQLSYAADSEGQSRLNDLSKHSQQIGLLEQLGFKVPDQSKAVCSGIEEVITRVQEWEAVREEYPYEIDGIVIKVNEYRLQELCGSTNHHPRWAVAYKFKAKQATTKLIDVEYQVGKVGSITPVAKLDPVALAGVTISSVSLHNEEFITERDLHLGDTVLVERAGDVIPYIVKAMDDLRDGSEKAIIFPSQCPSCSTDLIKPEGEAKWQCPNYSCRERSIQRVIFHVSKAAMDIDGFGKSYVERFYELGWINDISDIYHLDYEAIANLDGFGERSANKLRDAIEKAKKSPIQRLLHSLSIHHLGKKASQLLAEQIESVFDLASWTEENFTAIKDIGPVVAQNVMAYFAIEENVEMLRRMESYGVNMLQTEEDKPLEIDADAPFAGKTILFTGTLQQMGRNEAKKIAEGAGAKTLSAVSKNLDILVVGEKAGSKLKKAEKLGTVEIMTEEEFLDRING